MRTLFMPSLSLATTLLFCSALQASSFSYTFTFDKTSVSALTSFSMTSPTLLPATTQRFTGAQFKLIDSPSSGATLPDSLPVVILNQKAPGIFVPFSQTAPYAGLWQFTGITAALDAVGTYNFQSGSTVSLSVKGNSTTDPVTGFIKIANVPAVSTPEPAAWLLSCAGLVCLGLFAYVRRNIATE